MKAEADRIGLRAAEHRAAIQGRLAASAQTGNAVQPMLLTAGLVGLAGLAYGGYRYFRRYQRESAIGRIRQEQRGHNHLINQNVEGHGGVGVTSSATTLNGNVAVGLRQYDLYINLDDPVGSGGTSPSLVESARIHERTHVTNDQSYSANSPVGSQQIFHVGHGPYHAYPIYDRADKLLGAIQTDGALSEEQRGHLSDRVRSNSIKPIEWDSTINELLVYTREEGISANSATVKLLVQYANENLEHRSGRLQRLPRLRPDQQDNYHMQQEGWQHVFG